MEIRTSYREYPAQASVAADKKLQQDQTHVGIFEKWSRQNLSRAYEHDIGLSPIQRKIVGGDWAEKSANRKSHHLFSTILISTIHNESEETTKLDRRNSMVAPSKRSNPEIESRPRRADTNNTTPVPRSRTRARGGGSKEETYHGSPSGAQNATRPTRERERASAEDQSSQRGRLSEEGFCKDGRGARGRFERGYADE